MAVIKYLLLVQDRELLLPLLILELKILTGTFSQESDLYTVAQVHLLCIVLLQQQEHLRYFVL